MPFKQGKGLLKIMPFRHLDWILKLFALKTAQQGTSAIEFALLSPVLIIALLGMVDIGREMTERMTIGSILRVGAQRAIAGGDVATVESVLRAAASHNFTLSDPGFAGNDTSLALQVERICACVGAPLDHVACMTTCTGQTPTAIYVILRAEKTYSGILLPRMFLYQSMQVQVR
jgi:hypothetical protein